MLHSFFFTCTCSTMLISLTVKKEHYDIHVTDSWRVSTVTTSKIFNQYTSVMSNKMKIAEIKTKIFLITRYLKSNHKQQITNKNKVHCVLHLNLKVFVVFFTWTTSNLETLKKFYKQYTCRYVSSNCSPKCFSTVNYHIFKTVWNYFKSIFIKRIHVYTSQDVGFSNKICHKTCLINNQWGCRVEYFRKYRHLNEITMDKKENSRFVVKKKIHSIGGGPGSVEFLVFRFSRSWIRLWYLNLKNLSFV